MRRMRSFRHAGLTRFLDLYHQCVTVGTTPDCSKAANPYARNFTLGVAARLRRHGGWRFLEPLGQGISWCVSRHHDSKCLLAIWVAFFESAKQYEDRCGQDGSKCNVTVTIAIKV